MIWFGTDVVALGCIIGSAAVGGAATLAIMDGDRAVQGGCGVEAMAVSPRIAVSHSRGSHSVVVTPDVRIHSVRDCDHGKATVIELQVEDQLRELDVHLEQMDRALELQMEAFESQLEAQLEQGIEARLQAEEAMRQLENAHVKVVVAKARRGGA